MPSEEDKQKLNKLKNNNLYEQEKLLTKTQKKQLKYMFKRLDEIGIVYQSTNICFKVDINNEVIKDLEYDRFKKDYWHVKRVIDEKKITIYNQDNNGSCIFLGDPYELIGIDVDNKEDTIEKFEKICIENEFDYNTLIMKTCNKGYHYYFKVSIEQKELLKDISSMDGQIFNKLHIDVKYNRGLFYGPSVINYENEEYKYYIQNDSDPAILPDFLFNEIYTTYKKSKKIIKKKKKSKLKEVENLLGDIKETEILTDTDTDTDDELLNKIKTIQSYADCLSVNRWTNTETWIRLGFIFSFELNKSAVGYNLFKKYSKKTIRNNYDEDACFNLYYDAKIPENEADIVTINTLYLWAIKDNPKLSYKNRTNDKNYLYNEIFLYKGISDLTAARLFYNITQNKYIFDSENKNWYNINEYGIWKKDNSMNTNLQYDINVIISTSLEIEYIEKYKKYKNKDFKKAIQKNHKYCFSYLCKYNNKKSIVNELQILFYNDNIYGKFDISNLKLFAFENGVYDLESNQFRLAKPDELITCSCGYNFLPMSDDIKERIEKLKNYLNDLLPPDELKYLLQTISLSLSGETLTEKYYCWIGVTCNGKSFCQDLCYATFGTSIKGLAYSASLPIEYMVKSKHGVDSARANPVIARLKNCRIVFISEPDDGAELRGAKIKQLSGHDKIVTRDLFQSSFEYIPRFSMFFLTNNELIIPIDKGIKGRADRISFPNVFCENPVLPNEKKIDYTLRNRVQKGEFALEFFYILLEHYKTLTYPIKIPERILKETNDYFNRNDPVEQLINEVLTKTTNVKDKIKGSDLFKTFKEINKNNNMNVYTFYKIMEEKAFIRKEIHKAVYFTHVKYVLHDDMSDDSND